MQTSINGYSEAQYHVLRTLLAVGSASAYFLQVSNSTISSLTRRNLIAKDDYYKSYTLTDSGRHAADSVVAEIHRLNAAAQNT